MCGRHIDTVRTGGRYDGNLGVLAGLEVIETLDERGVIDRPPRWRWPSSPTRRAPASRPTCWARSCTPAGWPLEEALDIVAIDGARLGDELERIGYAGPPPCPGVVPHAFVELHIEQGPVLEAEGVTIGAVTGVQGISWQELTIVGPVEPRRHHADGAAPRRRSTPRPRSPCSCAASRCEHRRPPGRHRRPAASCTRTWSTWSPARPCSPSTCATPTSSPAAGRGGARARLVDELAAAEGVTITCRRLARFEPVDVRRRHRRPGRGARPPARPLGAAHAVGRGPRRPDAGPRVPDRHDLRADRRGPSATIRPSTPTPPTSRPAPTCCADVLLALASTNGSTMTRELVTVGAAQIGSVAARRTRVPTSSSGSSSCCATAHGHGCELVVFPELALTTFFPRWFVDDIRPSTTTSRPFDAGRRTPSRCSTRRSASASASASATPSSTADGHRYNTQILVGARRPRSSARYRKVHLPGHEEHEP